MNKTEITAVELKETLRQILNGEKHWEKKAERQLINSMLKHIGSTDSLLRDTYIYGTFCKLVNEKQLGKGVLEEMLDKCLTDEMLFKGINEKGTDSVFTRSFTTLLIALVLYSDNESNFLSAEAIAEVKEKLIVYMEAEKDLRGYVSGKGWAHSIAHAADAFDELVKNRFADAEMHKELLDVLWKKALVAESVYVHDEEERILVPILELIKRGLDREILERLLQGLPAEIHLQKEQLEEENYWFLIANAKKFLKSFFIQINGASGLEGLQKSIGKCLAEL